MTYYYRSKRGIRPKATMSPSISWQKEAGKALRNTSTTLSDDGVKLEAVVETRVSGAEVPSYVCTSTFSFSGGENASLNSVSRKCVSKPVLLTRTYLRVSNTEKVEQWSYGNKLS